MATTYVEIPAFAVLRVRADMNGAGPPAAFHVLESMLPTLKGRKFYGSFLIGPDGEEYYACVARVDSDDPEKLQLDAGMIPGGWYARRKLLDWESKIPELPKLFEDLARTEDVAPERPSLEFYRSHTELQLLVPIRNPPARALSKNAGPNDEYDSRSSVMDDEGRAP